MYGAILFESGGAYRKGKLRILGEFLWWATHRALIHLVLKGNSGRHSVLDRARKGCHKKPEC